MTGEHPDEGTLGDLRRYVLADEVFCDDCGQFVPAHLWQYHKRWHIDGAIVKERAALRATVREVEEWLRRQT